MDFDFEKLEAQSLTELRELAKSLDVSGYSRLKKEDLILRLLRAKAEGQGYIFGLGAQQPQDQVFLLQAAVAGHVQRFG